MSDTLLGGRRHVKGMGKKGRGRKGNGRTDLNKAGSIIGSIAVYRSLIIFGIIIIGLIIGIIYTNLHQKNWILIRANISDNNDKNCHMDITKTSNTYTSIIKCDYNIYFYVNGQRIDTTLKNVNVQIIPNGEFGSIDIEYNPNNPYEVDIPFKDLRNKLNIILPVILLIFIFIFYLFYKYRNNNVVKGIAIISWISNMFSTNK
jgi:hypothetical protein